MGFITRILSGQEQRGLTFTDAINTFLRGDDHTGAETAAGPAVDEFSSLSLTSIYACVGIISRTLASIPLMVYENLNPGKDKATGNPLYKLLHDSPNPMLTSFMWRQITSAHQLLWGAGISEIEFNAAGEPVALWPIPPWRVTPKLLPSKKDVVYIIRMDDGSEVAVPGYKMAVFPALTTSVYQWLSPIGLHRETVGAAFAVKEFGARTFGQGTNPAGIVTKPAGLTETAEACIKQQLSNYAGLSKSHRVMLLEAGMDFKRIGLPPEDAQYLETRRFDVSEIARIYNVPLFMLQDHEKQTSWGSGIEEQKDGFITFTMLPYVTQWEQELTRKLFINDDSFFPEFLLAGLLRGKLTDRYAAYVQAINNGIMSPNEVRERENMNPYDGGDVYLAPLNAQSIKQIGKNTPDNVKE